jgi:hypothetical protein
MTKTYVKQWFPRSFFDEDVNKPCDHRDPDKFTPDRDAYAFQFLDRSEVATDGETLIGPWKNQSPTYFPGGVFCSCEEIESWGEKYRILLSNTRGNGYKGAIKHRRGSFSIFEEGKTVLIADK